MVRKDKHTDEITMLREYQDWLLRVVIPSAYYAATEKVPAHTDYATIDNTLEQLFDIAYQIKLLTYLDRVEGVKALKQFNAIKRRDKDQTFLPYEND